MNRPLFSVGEKVILQSETYPWYNGVYVVEKLVKPGERIIDRIKEGVQTLSLEEDGICYILDEPLKNDYNGGETFWRQSALRKINKPSQFTFDQLISEIKCPRSITQ